MGNDPGIALGGNWLVRFILLVLLTHTQNQYSVFAVFYTGGKSVSISTECKNQNQDVMKNKKLSKVSTAVFC